MAAKQTYLQSICEVASGDVLPEAFGKNLRRIIYNFCGTEEVEAEIHHFVIVIPYYPWSALTKWIWIACKEIPVKAILS